MTKQVDPPKPKKKPKSAEPEKVHKIEVRDKTNAEIARAKRDKKEAERKAKLAEKRLKDAETKKSAIENKAPYVATSDKEVDSVAEDVDGFKPNPGPQTTFLAASEQEVLYGGAAGGGKSYAMLVDPLRYCHIGQSRAILFRRTNDALRELIMNSKQLYPMAFKGAKWSQQKSTWTFPSGAEIWLTYLDKDDDVVRYQGQAFNWIGFDELTQWPTAYPWDYMRSRLRTTHPELPLVQRASTNPGGVGTQWVKKMFIDPAPWGEPFDAVDIETGEVLRFPPNHSRAGEPLFKRRFIPARLQDNPYLWEGGEYEANLMSLPEIQRKRLLEGDWDVVDGAAFPEFNRNVHVVEPYDIPRGWFRFRAADWGYREPACCLWFAVDYDGNLIVYRELYASGILADDFARMVLEAEEGENIRYGVLDGSAFSKRGETSPSPGEIMNKMGCRWRPADRSPGSRVKGKLQVHYRLKEIEDYDGNSRPRLTIFNNCKNLIRTLPTLPVDDNNSEDVDTDAEDHAYDAFRYGCASRPLNPASHFDNEFGGLASNKERKVAPVDPVFGY